MSDFDSKTEAARLSSDWLDTAPGDDPPPDVGCLPANEELKRHLADHQLVSALLSLLSPDWKQTKERQVRRVMQVISASEPAQAVTRHPRRSASAWRAAGVVAACVCLVGFFLWKWPLSAETRAAELLLDIRNASRAAIDRVYEVSRYDGVGRPPKEHLGTLYLRGVAGFVLSCEETTVGRSGQEFWLVSRSGEVILSDDFEWLACRSGVEADELALLKQLSVESRHVPLMDLAAVVELIRSDYDVSLEPDAVAAPASPDQFVARRRALSDPLPDRIALQADAATHIVRRAELIWDDGGAEGGPHRLVLELVPGRQVADDWYHHTRHHADQAPVRHVRRDGQEFTAE